MQAISFFPGLASIGLRVVLRECCRDESCRGVKSAIGSGEKCDSRYIPDVDADVTACLCGSSLCNGGPAAVGRMRGQVEEEGGKSLGSQKQKMEATFAAAIFMASVY